MERKRVFYYSFEELYKVARNPQGEAGILANALLGYYGFSPMIAFTIVNDATQGTPSIIFHVGNEEDPVFQTLMQNIEEYNDYYDAVEETIEDIEEGFEEKTLIGIIVFDGNNTGIAIGFPYYY